MHRCTNSCFGHRERQGSGCLCDTNAGRQIFGLEPLTGDEPELDAVGPALWAVIVVSAIVIVIGFASALADYLPHAAFLN